MTPVRAVELRTGGWSSGPLLVARTRRHRRCGVLPEVGPLGMLFATRSIHGWGLTTAVRWVGLDGAGRVVGTGMLHPRRMLRGDRGQRWVAETAPWVPAPPLGAVLEVTPILAVWSDD